MSTESLSDTEKVLSTESEYGSPRRRFPVCA